MNYQRIHNEIIARAKAENRKKTKGGIYYERHHIVPKCLGGGDNRENLVLLTAREHFLIHWLLAEIYDNKKMWCALNSMLRKANVSTRYYPSSRVMGSIRERSASFTLIKKGKDNAMYGRTIYDFWLEKYGKEIADIKWSKKKEISILQLKSKNPSFKIINESLLKQMFDLKKQGFDNREISEKLNVGFWTVSRYCSKKKLQSYLVKSADTPSCLDGGDLEIKGENS